MTSQKTIDERIVEGSIAKLIAADLVCFRSGNSQCVARLTQVNSYVFVEAMLHNIHHNSCLPGCKNNFEALDHYHPGLDAKRRVSKYGVVALYYVVLKRESLKDGIVIGSLPLPPQH